MEKCVAEQLETELSSPVKIKSVMALSNPSQEIKEFVSFVSSFLSMKKNCFLLYLNYYSTESQMEPIRRHVENVSSRSFAKRYGNYENSTEYHQIVLFY